MVSNSIELRVLCQDLILEYFSKFAPGFPKKEGICGAEAKMTNISHPSPND